MSKEKPTLEEQIREAEEAAGTTAVATREPTNGAVTEYAPSDAGMSGEFDEGDIKLPTCRLLQPMSQAEGGQAGHYWFDQEGRDAETFTAVVLNIIGTAAMWEPIGAEGKGPICKSIDRVMGLTNKPSVVTGKQDVTDGDPMWLECKLCPHHADWEVLKSGPMHCSKGFTLLMAELDAPDQPYLYYVKGTQFTPVRDRIVSPALMRRKRYGAAQPWLTPFTWASVLKEQPGKKYFVPTITAEQPLNEEERSYFAALSAAMRGRAEEQAIDEMEEQPGLDIE